MRLIIAFTIAMFFFAASVAAVQQQAVDQKQYEQKSMQALERIVKEQINKIENTVNQQEQYDQKARQTLEWIVKEQLNEIENTANSTQSADEHNIKGYVLSTHVRTFSDISENINHDIQEVGRGIRLLIRYVATDIEVSGNRGSLKIDSDGRTVYKPNSDLSKLLNDKRENLLKANLKNCVSVRSAALAIRLLAGINDELMEQTKYATTRQEKERVYIKQAVYVYEMADITLELLDGLTLEGKATIISLHEDAQGRVQQRIADIERQLKKVQQLKGQNLLTTEQIDKEIETYTLMRTANERSLDAWKDLLNTMSNQQEFLDNLRNKKTLIEYKRDKARVQLETLRDLREIAELKDAIGSLDDLVATVADFDLLVLVEETVRILLGYDASRYERESGS